MRSRALVTPQETAGRLVVVTPWYPTDAVPYGGAFVRDTTRALLPQFPDPLVVHVEVLRPQEGAAPRPARAVVDGLDVLHLPVVLDPLTPRADVARHSREALAPYTDALAAASAVHVHVGMPTGWAVVDLVGDRTRVVLSEHASYLKKLWSLPESEQMYASTVRGAAQVTAVGVDTSRALRQRYPDCAERVHTVPNPVDVDRFVPRDPSPTSLHRWLYVGNLLEAKGVLRLVRAFAAWHAQRPTSTLTVAGGGVDGPRARELADELGVRDAVRFLGRVAPQDVPALYRDADVLVHLSASETFGLTAVEALCSHLPVVATATRGGTRTLDVAQDEGMAVLVPVPAPDVDASEDVVAAVRRLEERLGTARPDVVRRDLEARFGASEVAHVLGCALRGERVDEPGPDDPLVVAIAVDAAARPDAQRVVRDAVRRGARAVLVADGPRDPELDTRVVVLDLRAVRAGLPSHRVERWVVDTAPRAAVRLGAPVARALGRPGAADSALRRQEAWSARWERVVGSRVRARTDPAALARAVPRREPDLFAGAVLVTWGDERGRALAERVARANPDALVLRHADVETVATRLAQVRGD